MSPIMARVALTFPRNMWKRYAFRQYGAHPPRCPPPLRGRTPWRGPGHPRRERPSTSGRLTSLRSPRALHPIGSQRGRPPVARFSGRFVRWLTGCRRPRTAAVRGGRSAACQPQNLSLSAHLWRIYCAPPQGRFVTIRGMGLAPTHSWHGSCPYGHEKAPARMSRAGAVVPLSWPRCGAVSLHGAPTFGQAIRAPAGSVSAARSITRHEGMAAG